MNGLVLGLSDLPQQTVNLSAVLPEGDRFEKLLHFKDDLFSIQLSPAQVKYTVHTTKYGKKKLSVLLTEDNVAYIERYEALVHAALGVGFGLMKNNTPYKAKSLIWRSKTNEPFIDISVGRDVDEAALLSLCQPGKGLMVRLGSWIRALLDTYQYGLTLQLDYNATSAWYLNTSTQAP